MSWYYIAIEAFSWLFIFFMVRHGGYRSIHLLHMFQQKGYKLNEFSAWLLKRWKTILLPARHGLLLLVVLASKWHLASSFTSSALTVVLLVVAVSWFGVGVQTHEKAKKPLVFTARMKRLASVLALLIIWLPVAGTSYAVYSGLLFPDVYILITVWVINDLLLPFYLFLAALLAYPAEFLVQEHYKRKARRKLASMPGLKVIAITGSYGKTSTKFMLASILGERYRVCATPGSFNTPMGICKVINNDLRKDDQILILEMGARYPGNIDELCRIARPDMAIITNVGMAHLESFGTTDIIAQTKRALLDYLAPGGWAVLNGDDERVRKMPHQARQEVSNVLYCGLMPEFNSLTGGSIRYDENGCRFTMTFFDKDKNLLEPPTRVRMRLLGEHNVQNALLAAGMAWKMGLRPATVQVALNRQKPVPHRLELKKQNGVIIIDDAFNSNPVGARNAVSVLSLFDSGSKYIVTPGMIELGDRQDEENENFGGWIAQASPDHVYLIGSKQTAPIRRGLVGAGYPESRISLTKSLSEANDLLWSRVQAGDAVLYENDLPDSYNEPA